MLSKLSERYVGDMLRCLGDILAFFHAMCFVFSGKMSERHVKMSWRHLGIFQGKCLRDMFRCLGDIFLRARCLRDILKSVGDILFSSGKMSEKYVKMSERHVKVSERQFGIFFRQDVCVPC